MRLNIEAIHCQPDGQMEEYVKLKIGKLDHLIPRHARKTAHADVKLKGGPGRGKKSCSCEVIVHVPNETITTSQTAESINAAVDMTEAKLKNQLKKYKDKHILNRRRTLRRLVGQIRR